MNSFVRTLLWMLLCFAVGVGGYLLGVRSGAESMTTVAAHDTVSRALTRIDSSLIAIEKNDVEYALRMNRAELRSALSELGTYAETLVGWRCSERDRRITAAANDYLDANKKTDAVVRTPAIERALRFCAHDAGAPTK